MRAAALALGRDAEEPELREASALAEGSVGRVLDACWKDLHWPCASSVVDLLERLPAVDPQALHALGDAIGGFEPQRLASFIDAVNEWLADRLASADRDRMLRIAEAWDKINQAARDADEYNLERKPLVFSVFGWLAEAARG